MSGYTAAGAPEKKARTGDKPPAADASCDEWAEWARLWASWDPNATTSADILEHADKATKAADDLKKLLGSRLEFGTAGLRAPMGSGSAKMNDLTVIQSTQGVAKYLEKCFGDAGKERGVVLGYDHRAQNGVNSRTLCEHAAAVLMQAGFKVYLFDQLVATPMIPFVLQEKKCCAGIMITASHNPKADNGYKLYWENGAQIIPPHDEHIAKMIEDNLKPWTDYSKFDLKSNAKFNSAGKELIDTYFQKIQKLCHFKEANAAAAKDYPITYTAMHGVGYPFIVRSFEAFGHGVVIGTPEQIHPDADFPTVAFPNPEEGKGALTLAFNAADKAGSVLVLANDPDADRLAVAEKQEDGTWRVFTGNEIGALLGHWTWRMWKEQNAGKDPSDVHMVASTVSSKFLAAVAKKEGFKFHETLTGFKWMGSKAAELCGKGSTVLFSYEEAIGFCIGDVVYDKDGVSAAGVFGEMAKKLKSEGKSCFGYLNGLCDTYGHMLSQNSYCVCHDPKLTLAIFAKQRKQGGESNGKSVYASELDGLKVTGVRDLTEGHSLDTRQADLKPELPLNKGGEMITYYFEEIEALITLRTSGTEPKIKWYSEMRCEAGAREESGKLLNKMVRAVVMKLLDPYTNGLQVRPQDEEILKGK